MFTKNNLKNKTIIAFEGVDGTGKTTIAKNIAAKNNYRYIHCPFDEWNQYKYFVEVRFQKFPLTRFFFYLSTIWEVYQEILNDKFYNVFLVDRYVLSTLIYHKILFEKLNLQETNRLLNPELFPPGADLNLVLICNSNIRKERISKRRLINPSFDKALEENQKLQDEIQDAYKSLQNVSLVDTSFRKINEVENLCEILIKHTIAVKSEKIFL